MERDMLLREFSALGLYSKPTRFHSLASELLDYQVAIPINEDPNTVVQEAAVLPFSVSDRQCLYVDLLSNASNLKQTKANAKKMKNNAILGVNIQNIKNQLQLYVDFQVIEKALIQYRADIMVSSDPVNAVFTEAIHQFQAKIFTDSEEWDGSVGPSTLASLGFIFHLNKVFSAHNANNTIKKIFKKQTVKDSIELYKTGLNIPTLNGITGDNWFDYIINPTLLGWRGSHGRGFHTFLVLKFRKAEERLYKLLSGESSSLFETTIKGQIHGNFSNYSKSTTNPVGNVPSILGRVLAIKQHHKDTREVSDSTPKSFHLSGLAIDINYDTSPWVKGSTGLKLLKNAAPMLVNTTQHTAQKYFEELALSHPTGTGIIFDTLYAINNECKIYLKTRKTPINWGSSVRSNKEGFLNHRKELVVVLRDEMNLAWGALDIGNGDMGNGDMMHFDMRTSTIGQAFFNAADKSSSIDYLKTVHPYFRVTYEYYQNAIPPRTFEPPAWGWGIPVVSPKPSYRETTPRYQQHEMETPKTGEVLKAIQDLEADYLSQKLSKKPIWLEYDGQEVKVFMGEFKDKTQSILFRAWMATSGLPGHQISSEQANKDEGPVPEGTYRVSLYSKFLRKTPVSSSGETQGNDGVSFLPWGYKNNLYWGWGQWRARLNIHKLKYPKIKRDHFYFHDSYKGHSHGCVETETDLLYMLCIAKKYQHKHICVNIDYSIDTTKKGTPDEGSTDGRTAVGASYKPWKYFTVKNVPVEGTVTAIAIPDNEKTKAELKAFYRDI